MTYKRTNKGVCSLYTEVQLSEEGVIEALSVMGGCNGNLKGICALAKGLEAEEVIARLQGITCGTKKTSCPDQIAITLREALAQQSVPCTVSAQA
ncbi:MAG: TIGR03905 family TSCPD domain-containing protein [Oscillospiraceae bacterium]|nr:TIGR03905 family TSCPD domain-containing protein [Oscillospiraceae bacterium]